MTFSKTTEYALRILVYMASEKDKLLSSNTLHNHLKIPKKYLQRLMTDLSKNGLIISVKGKYGGYRLAKSTKKIYLSDIIEAVEGFKNTPSCFFGFSECALEEPCAMHEVWSKSQEKLIKTISITKLEDLVKKK
jgi:Rrf2 family protein